MDKGRVSSIDPDQCAPSGHDFSVIWNRPEGRSRAALMLAHGAGAAMDSEFMERMAQALSAHAVTVLRFEFDYMAARRKDGRKRPPNPQASLLEQWRWMYAWTTAQLGMPPAIGGKSMGGRMASLVADELQVPALICLGYPFHPPGKSDKLRIAHLQEANTPALVVQGTRDAFGTRDEVKAYPLSSAVHLHWLLSADHDFKPLKSSGRTQAGLIEEAAARVAEFLLEVSLGSEVQRIQP